MPEHKSPPAHGHPDRTLLAKWRAALGAWETSAATVWPTSQVLGGGAVAAVEKIVSEVHGGRPCLLLPSATYALRLALAAAGVSSGSTVTIVEDTWPAGTQAARSLGAVICVVPPSAVEGARLDLGRGPVLITDRPDHVDLVRAIRAAAHEALVIEDASRLHPTDSASPVRQRSGEYVVYSLGPSKPVDAGEGGLLVCPDASAHARALALSAHPTRLDYEHLTAHPGALHMRVHPMTAVLAWWALAAKDHEPNGP